MVSEGTTATTNPASAFVRSTILRNSFTVKPSRNVPLGRVQARTPDDAPAEISTAVKTALLQSLTYSTDDGLDVVPVEVESERRVVLRAVAWPWTGY
jgi:hypothetical protein